MMRFFILSREELVAGERLKFTGKTHSAMRLLI